MDLVVNEVIDKEAYLIFVSHISHGVSVKNFKWGEFLATLVALRFTPVSE